MEKGYPDTVYVCDKCKKVIVNVLPRIVSREWLDSGNLIIELSRKGKILHFCSEDCCKAHRGLMTGLNRLAKTDKGYRFPHPFQNFGPVFGY